MYPIYYCQWILIDFVNFYCMWLALILHYLFFFFFNKDVYFISFQNGPLLFSKPEYVLAWIVRELTSTYIFILAVANPHYIKWGARTFRVKLGGLTELVKDKTQYL